jgi:hypothetical protein
MSGWCDSAAAFAAERLRQRVTWAFLNETFH